ncbi:AAA family ATPase [Fibrella aquatilis]|uniref:AAA family ATPase n=1 Tax=Fibrella aquatilis TaxID=2817059 RepID=A0A939G666_9BACT|nr:AAA family ATPase [Fibrella aquatilis]MBO0930528.1 AAA family ATPase [Fibrella aquatilis]
MATLKVKNVGPIRDAELDVKKHTIFIGPQGSGKSTLAKLIAIGADEELTYGADINHNILKKYFIHDYANDSSSFIFNTENYSIRLESKKINISYTEEKDKPIRSNETLEEFLNETITYKGIESFLDLVRDKKYFENLLSNFVLKNKILQITSTYVPSERNLLSLLNESIWSLVSANVDFPRSIISFARLYSQSRTQINNLSINFLNVKFQSSDSNDHVFLNDGTKVELSQSASGYQTIIPLLVVIEQQRRLTSHRFIVEEPELNLYPIAQKDLIYALVSGLDQNIQYREVEWVITTHSPYVLSSYNTLMLAYKVASKSHELRSEVEKIIPARCWINPADFAAYYVDNGTVRSIIDSKTGLIMDNELDDVSEQFAAEQDQLLELNRSVARG